MIKVIVRYGIFAGLIVGSLMMGYMLSITGADHGASSMVLTYLVMLLALSMVFVGIKQYRDRVLGGVIKFGPALLVGLGISAVAGIFYAVAWEITMPLMKFNFIESYANSMIDQARASGAGPAEIEKVASQAGDFTRLYANPLFRFPMTFLEIFPVGVVVTLVSAAILRNSGALPART